MDDIDAPDFITEIVLLLRDGYGVEDIQIKTGHSADKVREIIARLRKIGALRLIYGRPA